MLPFLIGLAVLGAAWYLRAGDATARSRGTPARTTAELMRASARAKVRATFLIGPTLGYAILVAAAVGTALYARGRFGGGVGSGATTRWTAFAFAYVTLAGPRALAPRRQFVRLLSALARGCRATAYTGLVTGVLAVAAVAAACVVPPTGGRSRPRTRPPAGSPVN